jgi:hypothetical protein
MSCQLFLKDFQTSQKSQKAQRSTQVEGVRLQCNVLEYGSVLYYSYEYCTECTTSTVQVTRYSGFPATLGYPLL